eukprot:TRINITY_DN4551_c1_g3_i1.p1 TRINITY_DN4551_c1_g3~~TRINITY_DN4551_c1_g3_i1.p1  ORF type:complete len:585 (-),score=74.45 TRINITY_DN4551_c1_g3_i1:35-1789(-)
MVLHCKLSLFVVIIFLQLCIIFTLGSESYEPMEPIMYWSKNKTLLSVDFTTLKPNVVGDERIWIIMIQDLPNSTPQRQVYVESAKHYKIQINIVGIEGTERFKEWQFGLKLLWQTRVLASDHFKDSDYILFADAWDFFFTSPVTTLASHIKTHYANYSVIFAADPDTYPDQLLRPCFHPFSQRSYPFLNGGFQLGRAWAFRRLHHIFKDQWTKGADDQAFWSWVYVNYLIQNRELSSECEKTVVKKRQSLITKEKLPAMTTDSRGWIVHQMCHTSHHISMFDGRVKNLFTSGEPVMLHYNANTEDKMVFDWRYWKKMEAAGTTPTAEVEYFAIQSKVNGMYIGDSDVFYLPLEELDQVKEMYRRKYKNIMHIKEPSVSNSAIWYLVKPNYFKSCNESFVTKDPQTLDASEIEVERRLEKQHENIYMIQNMKNLRFLTKGGNGRITADSWSMDESICSDNFWSIEYETHTEGAKVEINKANNNNNYFIIRNGEDYLKATTDGLLLWERISTPIQKAKYEHQKHNFLFQFVPRVLDWEKKIETWSAEKRERKIGGYTSERLHSFLSRDTMKTFTKQHKDAIKQLRP